MEQTIKFASPHIRKNINTRKIMLDVVIALLPAFIAANVIFGIRAFALTIICVISCVFFEWGLRKLLKKEQTISDLSAVVTGILLAFNLPVKVNLPIAVLGCFIAIVIVKQLFGGIGENQLNPAATARVVLLLTAMGQLSTWTLPIIHSTADAVSGATPLSNSTSFSLMELFLGNHSGSMGETCVAALLLGGVYLLIRKVINMTIPLTYIGTVFCFAVLFGEDPIRQILSGGLILGAFFMATDYSTSPLTNTGKMMYGLGLGIITSLIRFNGPFPEGVSFAILIMNLMVLPIDKITRTKPLGKKAKSSIDIVKPTVAVLIILGIVLTVSKGIHDHVNRPAAEENTFSQEAEDAAVELLGTSSMELISDEEYPTAIKAVWLSEYGDYAFNVTANGFGGEIEFVISIGNENILGITVIRHSETAGLGTKALELNYLNQFTELTSPDKINDVDAISGASISSEAVKTGVKSAFEAYNQLPGR